MSDYRHPLVYKWFKWKASPTAANFMTEESANNFIDDVRNNNNKVPDEIINEIKYKNSKTIIRQETI